MLLIKKTIERQDLTQVQAAQRADVAQSDISNIMRGRGHTYTLDRLFAIFHSLGGKVTIEASVGRKKERIAVFTQFRPYVRITNDIERRAGEQLLKG